MLSRCKVCSIVIFSGLNFGITFCVGDNLVGTAIIRNIGMLSEVGVRLEAPVRRLNSYLGKFWATNLGSRHGKKVTQGHTIS